MINSKTLVGSQKGMSKLVTARFGPGMLLQHDDLEQLNNYTRDLSKLLFRSFFGCGVVCGLNVDASKDGRRVKVIVSAGLALGCSGEPISVPEDQTVLLGQDCSQDIPPKLWVVLCDTNVSCAPRNPACAEDEMQPECTRIRKGFEIRVVSELPTGACGCTEPSDKEPKDDSCYVSHYQGVCGCQDDNGSDCDCACVLLGLLTRDSTKPEGTWQTDYHVRRFIRPVLIPDPRLLSKQPVKDNPPPGNETSGQGNGANALGNGTNAQVSGANSPGAGADQPQNPTPSNDLSANDQERLKALTVQLQNNTDESKKLKAEIGALKKKLKEGDGPAREQPKDKSPAEPNSTGNKPEPTAENNDPPAG